MKRLWIPAGAFFLGGLGMLLARTYMEMTGVVLVLLSAAMALGALFGGQGRRSIQILTILACAGVIGLMACMNLITCGGQTDWDRAEQADYAVVLGAAVREDGTASRIMRTRLQAAMTFLERNETAFVILSGGQGGDEPISEAQCMYETLLEMGAPADRLLLEDKSSTTWENLQNSKEILETRGGTDRPVALITSEFHQRRAAYIGSSLDLETCAVAAHTDQWFYRVNYTLREAFAFVKAAIQGAMD